MFNNDCLFSSLLFVDLQGIIQCLQLDKTAKLLASNQHLWNLLSRRDYEECADKINIESSRNKYEIIHCLTKLKNSSNIWAYKTDIVRMYSQTKLHDPIFLNYPTTKYIGYMENLTELVIDGINIQIVPQEWCNLKKLKVLSVTLAPNATIPKGIFDLHNLNVLKLTNLAYSETINDVYKLTELTNLKLTNCDLNIFPDIFNCLKLEKIKFNNNNISIVPDKIGNLVNLKSLNISSNAISSIPTSIGSLTNLQRLDLSNNTLCDLPASMSNLINLEMLNLNNNKLTSLSINFDMLINLVELYLYNNQLTSLPDSENILKLGRSSLRGNPYKYIPERLKIKYGM